MTHDCDSIIKRPNCETQESHFKNTRITIKPKNTKKKNRVQASLMNICLHCFGQDEDVSVINHRQWNKKKKP